MSSSQFRERKGFEVNTARGPGGETASETLIKSLDTRSNCNGCDYSLGTVGGSNLFWDTYYLWCPDDNPGCTPVITGSYPPGVYTSPECCTCNGGIVAWDLIDPNTNLYPCMANASSLPLRIKSILSS